MIQFLTLSEVLLILEDQIRNYGGIYGIRDINLLSSEIYMPQSSFDGKYLHKTIPAMAAAYAFHICQNHPFIDGNKRAALASSLVFLEINKYTFNCDGEILYNAIINVAKGETRKRN
jgi:death-on-curing protein